MAWRFFNLVVVALSMAAVSGLAACSRSSGQATPAPVAAVLPPVAAEGRVVADAVVVPQRRAQLSLPTGGVVAEVLVAEGQAVAAGDVILRLDAARQRASLAQAEAQLAAARARLADLQAGPRPAELAAAQAAVDAAQAQLDRLQEGARPEQIAAAQAALDGARAALLKVQEGPNPAQIAAAEAELANAEAAVAQAQAAYDRVAGSPDIGRRPEALQLEQATNNRNAAKARLDALKAGPTAADLAAAQARVRQAQAELDALQAPPRPSDLAAAQAELRRAQAQLDQLRAGPRPEALAAAEAEVAAAQAAVDQARAALADTELRAPFAGVVVEIVPGVGELVGAGQPLAQLADTGGWHVETQDLTEFGVVRLLPGMAALVEFDALRGVTLPGRVVSIQDIGKTRQGDVVYKVVVALEPGNAPEVLSRLRWGMSAQVTIETETTAPPSP